MINNVEILAPVGNIDSLYAAVRSGANAVYLGTTDFNARRNAANFDRETLNEAVKYCHIRGVRVYVTMNTLITDKEIENAAETIKNIALSGADAIIVQDHAVALLARKICPELELHASTQMSVTNINGVKALEELGFKRVVLARELSFDEIKDICESTSVEIEVFVHGALCTCVSGMCYMSSVIGQRSGNRGLCAQPCRLDMRLDDREHVLSLKDMSYIEHIRELIGIGVCSLKIEGRMKRPEYVAAAVTECKKAMLGEKNDMVTLKNAFSRSGFTDGYYFGKRDINMHGFRTKDDVTSFDTVKKQLQSYYVKEKQCVETTGKLTVKKNERASYAFSDGKYEVTVFSDVPQEAEKRSLDKDFAFEYLKKLGSTPYFLKSFECDIDHGLYLSIPLINAMKNEASEKLSLLRSENKYKTVNSVTNVINGFENHLCGKTEYILRFEKHDQFFGLRENVKYYAFPLKAIEDNLELLDICKDSLVCEMPAVTFQSDLKNIEERLISLKNKGLKTVCVGSICDVYTAKALGFDMIGNHGLNVTNTLSLTAYKDMGVNDICVSFELNARAVSALKGDVSRGALTYGHLPLMRLRRCPARKNGCGKCTGLNVIKDGKNTLFTLKCNEKKFSTLYNHIPLYSADKKISGCDFEWLSFVFETSKEAENIYDLALNGKEPSFPRTNGLYFRKLL